MRLFKHKVIHLVAVACIGIFVCGTAIAAGSPLPYDGYTVTDGTIAADCPMVSGVQAICVDGIADDGILERQITLPSGPNQGSYIQFILTDQGVSGDASAAPFSAGRGNLLFSNEDFIKQHHRAGGIASKQTIIESQFTGAIEERFFNDVIYNYGWAQNASNPWVTAYQLISNVDYTDPLNPVEIFNTTADITIDSGAYDNYGDVVIGQAIDMSDDVNTGVQKMQYDKKAGYGNLSTGGVNLPGGSNGGNISWGLFETVAAMWVGQVINTTSSIGDTTFGYTRFDNQDQGTSTSVSSLLDAEAAAWPVPPFTAVDTVASGMAIVSPTDPSAAAAPAPMQTVAAGTGSADNTIVATPLPYDQWSVSNGVYTLPPCPGYATCGPPIVNKQGMLQRIVTVDGVDYIQTIITESNATGDPNIADFQPGSLAFKSETFVRYNAFIAGIAASLHIADEDTAYQLQSPQYMLPSTAGQFVYNTVVKTGWAHGGPKDAILDVAQIINVEDQNFLDTSSMYTSFNMKRGETMADTSMDMFAAVGNTASLSSGFNFPIMMQTSLRSGAFQNTTHDAIIDPFLLPSNNGNLSWDSGDAVSVTWVGGEYVSSSPGSLSQVNSLSYTNLSTGESISSTTTDGNLGVNQTFDPNPEYWDPLFGVSPSYIDPFVPPL